VSQSAGPSHKLSEAKGRRHRSAEGTPLAGDHTPDIGPQAEARSELSALGGAVSPSSLLALDRGGRAGTVHRLQRELGNAYVQVMLAGLRHEASPVADVRPSEARTAGVSADMERRQVALDTEMLVKRQRRACPLQPVSQ
jgi:hypothetical protein